MKEQTVDKLSYFLMGTLAVATPCLIIPSAEAIAATPEDVAAFQYEIKDEQVKITGYSGGSDTIVVPGEIEGLPVTDIDGRIFQKVTLKTLDLSQTKLEAVLGQFNGLKIENLILPSTVKKLKLL